MLAAGEDPRRPYSSVRVSFESLRVYRNDDVIGLSWVVRSRMVMAIAAGMVAGLGFGSNSVAALITRGLAE